MAAVTSRERSPQTAMLAACALILLALPFVTSYNDLLTSAGIRIGLAGPLQSVGPVEARMVVALLNLLGFQAAAAGSQLVVSGSAGPVNLFISWNCIGWQSVLLLGLSLIAGLRGGNREAATQVVLIGLFGTVLVNVVRVTIVCLLAATAGRWPAVIFHDYAGTLLTIAWLFAFWSAAQRWLLVDRLRPGDQVL
jgi:exosortase/archaeosortase family protein